MSKIKKVLIVDDSDITREVYSFVLKNDFEIAVASDGAEAMELCAKGDIDLVLLDIIMPGVNGIEVCKKLKKDPATAEIKIILISSNIWAEDKHPQHQSKCDDYIEKPVLANELKDRIISQFNMDTKCVAAC